MREILVIKPSSLGDIVHTLPAVHAMKRAFPSASIRWLANTEWLPLLEGNSDLEEAIEFPRARFRGVGGLLASVGWTRSLATRIRPDLVLDFQGLLRSALIGRALHAKQFLGLSDAREGARFFYHGTADVRGKTHSVERYRALAERVGADISGAADFPLPDGARPAGFGAEHPYIVLHPLSRGSGKSLSPTAIRRLIALWAPIPVALVGRGERVAGLPTHAIDLVNRTSLSELIWLLRHAAFTVSVDSGPMHLAAAISGRLVAIHTWSDPAKVGPYRADAWVWKAGRLARVAEGPFPEGTRSPDEHDLESIAALAR